MYSFRKEPKGIDFFEIPRPLCLKGLHRLHLSFVFPPLREGKKQKVAEAVNLLWVLVSGYGPDDSIIGLRVTERWIHLYGCAWDLEVKLEYFFASR